MTDLTDSEIDNICAGYRQNAARIRHLQKMGLNVNRKPNGRPIVNRAHYELVASGCVATKSNEPKWSTK